ncbi:MAG: sialidase family protein [Runella sp.]
MRYLFVIVGLLLHSLVFANPTWSDTTKTYAMPLLARTPQGHIILTWNEKHASGLTEFCMAISKDAGKTFSEKQVIFASNGLSGSRLMRPKVLVKKDGSMIAVFANNTNPTGKRSLVILYSTSQDGKNWTTPQSVDTDPTEGIVRGFFDAVLLPNGEVAVAYLKDVKGSTKHEERDLRMAITKNSIFQPEKLLDATVCDCCNISLLVDSKGHLNVYYRDNNNDIRDIAKLVSTDNGATFSKSQILHDDRWEIKGCPHTGPFSTTFGKENLISWFAGGGQEKGLRLTNQAGKKLLLINDPTAKNAYVTASDKMAVMLWEQNNPDGTLQIAYQKVGANHALQWLPNAENGTNANGLVVGNELLVVHEVKNPNKRNSIKLNRVAL